MAKNENPQPKDPEPKNRFLMPREEREEIVVDLLDQHRKFVEEGVIPLMDNLHDALNNCAHAQIADAVEEKENMPDAQRLAYEEMLDARFEIAMRFKTEEEAKAMLDKPIMVNEYMYKLFGDENIKELENLISGDAVRTIDLMILQGEIDPYELVEYMHSSEEFAGIYRKMREIIDKMLDTIIPKMDYYIQAKNRGRGNIWRGSGFMFMEFFLLGAKLQLPTDMPILRNTLMVRFSQMILQEFYVRFYKDYFRWNPDKYDKRYKVLENGIKYLSDVRDVTVADLGDDVQDAFFVAANTYEAIMQNDKLMVKYPGKLEEEFKPQPVKSKEEWDQKLKELVEFSQRTKLDPFSIKQGDLVVDFEATVFGSPKETNIHLCVIDINFGRNEMLTLFLNRFTGELTMHFDSLPLTDFVSSETYNAIKTFVYDALLDYYIINPENETEEKKYLPPNMLVEKLSETYDEDSEFFNKVSEVLQSFTTKMEKSGSDLDKLSRIMFWEEEEGKYAQQIKGLKGNIVKSTLIKLLGDPIRIEGSHHTFICRDGSTYPIAIHSNKSVGTGLLTKCLKNFGIPIQEFVENL